MKSWHLLIVLTLAGGLLGSPAASQVADPSAGSQVPATQPTDRLANYIQAIRDARDPSAAVGAYARAVAEIGPDGTIPQSLLEAYVHRMVQFYLPEAARQQARMLVDLNPNDGIAWAVMGFVAARQGQMAEALADSVQAASRMPDNRFVQETAGQVLAWYDLNKPTVSDSLRSAIDRVRKDLQDQQSFARAYQDATSDLQAAAPQSAATTRPAATPSGQQQAYQVSPEQPGYGEPWPEPLYSYPETAYSFDNYGSLGGAYPAYPYGIYYPSMVYSAPYVAPDWWWWNTWWPYGPNWPFFGGHTVVVNDFDNHGRLFRLGSLLFEHHGGKFDFVGVDPSQRGSWLDRTGRVTAGQDMSQRTDISRAIADRRGFISRDSQSRIFSAGRAPERLAFSGPQGGVTSGRQDVSRDVWSGVPRVQGAQQAPRPTAVSPTGPRQRTDISRGGEAGRFGASGISSMRGTPAPRTITPNAGRSLAPRTYMPASPQIGRAMPTSPRMDVGRSVAPRSFTAPPSFGMGGSYGSSGISRGGFGTGGSMGAPIRSGGNISRSVPSGGGRR